MIEIYNEALKDLLVSRSEVELEGSFTSAEEQPDLILRNSTSEISVHNAARVPVFKKADIYELLRKATKVRATAETSVNKHSSRSHAICTLFVSGTYHPTRPSAGSDQPASQAVVKGSLNLCDLAGSERLKKAGSSRIKETCNINRSLSALSDVFSALNKKASHIPYRNSKLTQLLKPCFAGEGKVLMIVNVSGDDRDGQESLCSLRFANKVNETQVTRRTIR